MKMLDWYVILLLLVSCEVQLNHVIGLIDYDFHFGIMIKSDYACDIKRVMLCHG